jgi:hypothetical protein
MGLFIKNHRNYTYKLTYFTGKTFLKTPAIKIESDE